MPKILHKKAFWIPVGLIIFFIVAVVSVGILSLFFEAKESPAVYPEREYYGEEEMYKETMLAPDASAPEEYINKKETTAVGGGEEISRKIIKMGTLDMVVKKVKDSVTQITNLVEGEGGYISNLDIYTRKNKTQYGTIKVRVPSLNFEKTMEAIKAISETVEKESVSGIEVTEEYVDLQSRLKNLRAEEEQYREILKMATSTEDVLKVANYLFRTREEIETIEGRIRYLEDLTALATISIRLSEEPTIEIPTVGWKPLITVKKAGSSVIIFFQGLITLLIWVLFYVIPLGIITWLVIKIIKLIRRKTKKSTR